uniref:Uncharacterized protein n=1 Tax=Myoviridae sp. ctrEx11 TaxID=2825180 RepID=A0A8S5V5S8_9CAUD|nr:MAG TPA: hypothetical protein [Myoviridae sp. ctrEx11]
MIKHIDNSPNMIIIVNSNTERPYYSYYRRDQKER